MSFIPFNAGSLNVNIHKIKELILQLKVKFDIIAITKTWIEPNVINDFNINNYEAFLIKKGTRRGGGVVIYTNKYLSSTLAESEYVVVDNILECVTIELTI